MVEALERLRTMTLRSATETAPSNTFSAFHKAEETTEVNKGIFSYLTALLCKLESQESNMSGSDNIFYV